jgi:hypothetical protein
MAERSKVRTRVARVLINSGILFLLSTLTTFAIPGTLVLVREIPTTGVTFASAIALLLVFLIAFFGLRIVLDLIRLVDLTSDFLVAHIPGLNIKKRVSIVRALKEIIVVLLMAVAVSIGNPLLLLVPQVGWLLQLVLSIGLAIPAVILLYDAGRTLYSVFQSAIELFIDRLEEGARVVS